MEPNRGISRACTTGLLTLVIVTLLVGCRMSGGPSETSVPNDSTEVAFQMAGPGGAAVVVPVHVNDDGPYDFVLDTGATLTCLSAALADSLELPEAAGQVGMGATVGSSGRMRLVSIDSLRVGEVRASDLTACTVDLASLQEVGMDAHGLLGLNFLESFLVTLDFDRQIVRFEE